MPSLLLKAIAFSALLATAVHGKGFLPSPLPSTQIAPEPVSIVFPGFAVAAGVNAAALPRYQAGKALQEAFTPSLQEGDPSGISASAAAASKAFGFNVGYRGPSLSGGNTHGFFLGGGYQFSKLALGISLRDTDLSTGFQPALDVGMLFGKPEGFSGGFVAYQLDSLPQLAFGMGYRKMGKYQFEGTLLLPPFARLSDMASFTAAVIVYSEIFAFYIRSTVATQITGFSHTLGMQTEMANGFSLFAQFTTPRTITVGSTLLF